MLLLSNPVVWLLNISVLLSLTFSAVFFSPGNFRVVSVRYFEILPWMCPCVCVCVCTCALCMFIWWPFHTWKLVLWFEVSLCIISLIGFFFSCLLSWSSRSAGVERPGLCPSLSSSPRSSFLCSPILQLFFFLNIYIPLKYRWLTVLPLCSKVSQLHTDYFWNYFPV